jgi:hypothetical protein
MLVPPAARCGPAVPSLDRGAGAGDPFARVRIGVLTSVITPELVDEVIEACGCREQRRRLLPADAVIYLVLGMCLLSGDEAAGPPGYRAVMRSLSNGLRHQLGASLPTRQAFGKRRKKLGSKPLELLFDRSRGPGAAPGMAGAHAFGLLVAAWDGTTLDLPVTEPNLAAFGTLPGGSRPAIRLLALIECGTHMVIDAAFDGVRTACGGGKAASEHALARRVLASLRGGMLCLADRNFRGYELWADATSGGADLAWRIQDNRVLEPAQVLDDGSYLAILPTPEAARQGCKNRARGIAPDGVRVRVIDYTVTVTGAAGTAGTEDFRIITTLLDPRRAPAAEIAALYHERWESEGAYSEIKTRLKGAGFTLRSKTPDLACQELWAMLTVYHALGALQAAAACPAGADPGRISFAVTLRVVRDQAKSNDIITRPGVLDQALGHAITDMLADPLEPRRDRRFERKTSPAQRKYRTRNPATPRPASKISFTLTINTRRATTTRPPPAKTP